MKKDVVVRLRMTQKEADDLNKKVKLTGLTKSFLIRVLIAEDGRKDRWHKQSA